MATWPPQASRLGGGCDVGPHRLDLQLVWGALAGANVFVDPDVAPALVKGPERGSDEPVA